MRYEITTQPLDTIKTDCIILPIYAHDQLSADAKTLDKSNHKKLSHTLKQTAFTGETGKTLVLHQLNDSNATSIILVGCGDNKVISVNQYRKILTGAWSELKKLNAKKVIFLLHKLKVKSHDTSWNARKAIINFEKSLYSFDEFKSKKSNKNTIAHFVFHCHTTQKDNLKISIKQAQAIAVGINLTKDLGNTPPNICNPAYLAKQAEKLAKVYSKVTTKIIDEKEAKKMGMGSFCSVSQGSSESGKIIIMQYKGGKVSQKPIALIGKGITFDTGGNSMKTPAGMLEMKYDMCGAATVFGVLKAAAEINLKQNIIGIVASAENMVNGKATRPSDIVKSLSGITIEINNTDAEGRLALCDAITYSKKYKPAEVISIATLTGAVIAAFAHVHTGLLSNSQSLANHLIKAGEKAEDPAWQLPLTEDYEHVLHSEYADTVNTNLDRKAMTIVSACFLSKFTDGLNWAHLDIAGTSTIPGKQATASGRPVAMLMQYLFDK